MYTPIIAIHRRVYEQASFMTRSVLSLPCSNLTVVTRPIHYRPWSIPPSGNLLLPVLLSPTGSRTPICRRPARALIHSPKNGSQSLSSSHSVHHQRLRRQAFSTDRSTRQHYCKLPAYPQSKVVVTHNIRFLMHTIALDEESSSKAHGQYRENPRFG